MSMASVALGFAELLSGSAEFAAKELSRTKFRLAGVVVEII